LLFLKCNSEIFGSNFALEIGSSTNLFTGWFITRSISQSLFYSPALSLTRSLNLSLFHLLQ
jgi:hypothetical protein